MGIAVTKLVLLPGMYGTGELFGDFIEALPSGLVARAVEFPNDVSLSYAELLDLVRLRVSSWVGALEPYVVVAESFSTPLAIQFAATNPGNLRGLVLSAGFATSPVRGLLRLLTPFLAPLLAHLPVNRIGAQLATFGVTAPKPMKERLRRATRSVEPKVLMDRVQAVVACDVLEELRRVKAPLLFMEARRDRIVARVCLEEMRRVRSDIEVVALDASHMLMQQLPRETARIVAEFVRQL